MVIRNDFCDLTRASFSNWSRMTQSFESHYYTSYGDFAHRSSNRSSSVLSSLSSFHLCSPSKMSASARLPQESPRDHAQEKKKRAICTKCGKPTPTACICAALPTTPISLQHCTLVVLQHPTESKHKNRSLPLIELCLKNTRTWSSSGSRHQGNDVEDDECDLYTVVSRRFGNQIDPVVLNMLREDSDRDVILIYPGKNAVSLTEGLSQIQARRQALRQEQASTQSAAHKKIVVILLDATWKFAKQMHHDNVKTDQYPSHMISVSLNPKVDWTIGSEFRPRRFDIRTPPSNDHLSTAECIAWVTSRIEQDPTLYETFMRPLDLMVNQWHSFSDTKNKKRASTNNDAGDENLDDRDSPKKRGAGEKKKWVKIER